MKLQKLSLFSLSIFLLFGVSSFAFSYSGTILTDLLSPAQFSSDLSSWSVSESSCSGCAFTYTIPPNSCGISEEEIVGGPGTLGLSTESTFDKYYESYYSGLTFNAAAAGLEFDLYAFYDTTPSNPGVLNFYEIYLDNGYYSIASQSTSLESTCILDYSDSQGIVKVFYKYDVQLCFNRYYSNVLTLKFYSRFNVASTVSSFGLRNLRYYFSGSISVSQTIYPPNFPCYLSQYWDGSQCVYCHTYCKTCTGSTENHCTSCSDGRYDYQNGTCLATCSGPFVPITANGYPYLCEKKCASTDFYWTHNQSCSSTCSSPLQNLVDGNDVKVCYNRCYYDEIAQAYYNNYIYPDGTCVVSCSSSQFKVTTPFLCQSSCANSNEFVFQNGSCTSSCASPLSSPSTYGIKLCNSPCSGQYIMIDGTCSTSCPAPFVGKDESADIKFCANPCAGTGDFLYENGLCYSDCPSPLQSVITNGVKYCKNSCQSAGTFLYNNGTCIATCSPPWVERNERGVKYCDNPCLATNQFLYANGSCYNDCLLPLLSINEPGVKFCRNPCATAGTFLYDNSSCIATCATPLIEKDEPGVKFCMNPCFANNSYLLPNGSCSGSCLAPLESYSEPGVKYCYNPCAASDTFLSEDGSCQAACPLPNIERSESIGKFCKYPCANTALYYYTTDGKCKKTCEYPYQATESPLPKICSSSLSEEEIKQIKKLAETTDTANSASSSGILIGTILSSSDSTSVCMGPFSKMLSYVKYMDIVYPEKVQLMFLQQSESASKGGFTTKMAKNILKEFPDHELPEKFETYKANSSFFVNIWPALFNLLVILFVTGGVIALRIILGTSCSKVRLVVGQVEEILRWNVVLVTFVGNFGDIILFTALEFQTMQFEKASDGVSFAVCLMLNCLCIFVVVKILEVNSAVRKSKQGVKGKRNIEVKEKEIEKNWSSYKALFACYRDQTYFQQIFLFIFIVRISLFTGIIGYLYKYPLLQAILVNLVNVLILLYLLFKRPIKQLVNLIQQVILEFVLLPFNLCVLILAVLDYRGAEAIVQRKQIGNVVVYINVIIPVLSIALMATKFIVIGYQFYKQWKANKLKKKELEKLGNNKIQEVEYGDSRRIPTRIQTARKPQIFIENSDIQTNQMQTLDITQQSQLDLSTSQDASFVLNNTINPFISQSRRRPARFENRSLLTPSYSYQGGNGEGTRDIELVRAEPVSNNSLNNQGPQREGRIARRRNKISKERGSPSRSIGRAYTGN